MASSSRSAKDESARRAAARRGDAGSDSTPARDDLVTVGRIVAPHGLHGEVRVRVETDFPERFKVMRAIYLVRADRVARATLTGARPHRGGVLVTLEGVADRTAAEGLRGAEIAIARGDLARLPEGHYYVFEIVGLLVRTEDGRILGTVTEVLRGPANDIYVVRDGRREVLVPALRDVVRRIDPAAGEMVVSLPPGLEA